MTTVTSNQWRCTIGNLNKVLLLGRLTRDPEARSFQNGGKVTKIGFAVNNRRKDQQGEWVDEPVYLDCQGFNRGEYGRLADRLQELRKGQQILIEGHLRLDQWQDQDGNNRNKLLVVIDQFQYTEPRQVQDQEYGDAPPPAQRRQQPQRQAPPRPANGRPQERQQPAPPRRSAPYQPQGQYDEAPADEPFPDDQAAPGSDDIPF